MKRVCSSPLSTKSGEPHREKKTEVYKQASPATYVTEDDPPMLLIHGEEDTLVTVEQSTHMEAALKAKGVPAEFILVRGAKHGFRTKGAGSDFDLQKVWEDHFRTTLDVFKREMKVGKS